MARLLLASFFLALSSCEQEKPSPTETATNESAERMETQKEDLAKFMADFKASMDLKYGDSGITPEIENIDLLRIEGTHVFNYNFNLTLHQEDQIEPVIKELHCLVTLHKV